MKPGEQFDCPHCGKNTFLRKESVMDGWTKVGEVLKCASCGAEIGKYEEKTSASVLEESVKNKKNALADLLGEAVHETDKSAFLEEKRRFCRDCAFRVMNAFRIRCMKHDRDVNPMEDCPDFQTRSPEQEGADHGHH